MRQKEIIAKWLYSIRDKMDVSWAELARRANIKAATTLSRAVDMNHHSVMSVKNLEAIAQAAGMPSILDFLLYQSQQSQISENKIDQSIAFLQEIDIGKKNLSKNDELFNKILEENSF